jgi:hypothetical protein
VAQGGPPDDHPPDWPFQAYRGETVIGRDGKTYPSTRPKYEYDDDEPAAKLTRDPLAEAAKLKIEIIALMKLMRPIEREQFKRALLEDLIAMSRELAVGQ